MKNNELQCSLTAPDIQDKFTARLQQLDPRLLLKRSALLNVLLCATSIEASVSVLEVKGG